MKKSKEKKKDFHFLLIFEKSEFVKAKHVFRLFLFAKMTLKSHLCRSKVNLVYLNMILMVVLCVLEYRILRENTWGITA